MYNLYIKQMIRPMNLPEHALRARPYADSIYTNIFESGRN